MVQGVMPEASKGAVLHFQAHLDLDGNGKVTWQEFVASVRDFVTQVRDTKHAGKP
jgi:hypothetical protein